MIEAIVSAALIKIADGSAATLVDAIRQRFIKKGDAGTAVESLDRTAQGTFTEADLALLRAHLTRYASEDPGFLEELAHVRPAGATNVVAGSNVMKLVQAQNVGDITM